MSQRPLGVGGSRDWLVPVNPDGNRAFDSPVGEITGTHTGFYVGMNGHNMRPGYHYEWGNNNSNSRLLARQKGFQFVADTDDDAPACMAEIHALQDDSDQPTPLDTTDVPYPDLVYMRIPEELHRRNQQIVQERSAMQLGDQQVQNWIERANETGEQGGWSNPRGLRTRFAMNSHSVVKKDGEGHTTDQWVPPRGTTERG